MTVRAEEGNNGSRLLRVRVSIMGSEPEIWRVLEIDSSLTLDRIHDVLQTAVGWRDEHLHSFTDTDPYVRLRAVNGHVREPRRWVSEDLLQDNEGDLPETAWALGEVLTSESGPLFYEYDFGDSWLHRLELVDSIPKPAGVPRVQLLDGARRAPLEDSGGIGGYYDLLDALAVPSHDDHDELKAWVSWTVGPWQAFDPEHLDVDALSNELALLFEAPADDPGPEIKSLTQELTQRMPPGLRREFRSYLGAVGLDAPGLVDEEAAGAMTAPYLWLSRRVGQDGLSLTPAGWLPPAVVQEAMTELGWAKNWIGKANREEQTLPVLQLRESAQRLGLIRKIKGRLLLTPAGKRLVDDPVGLWMFIARSLAHRHRHDSGRDAVLLLLLEIAAGKRSDWEDYLEAVAFGLSALGWRSPDGADLDSRTLHALLAEPLEVLQNLGIFNDQGGLASNSITPYGKAFARAALHS